MSAKQVVDQGAPELIAAVDRGDVLVSAAAQVATLPVEWQQVIVANDVAGAAKDMRQGRQDVVEVGLTPRRVRCATSNQKLPCYPLWQGLN